MEIGGDCHFVSRAAILSVEGIKKNFPPFGGKGGISGNGFGGTGKSLYLCIWKSIKIGSHESEDYQRAGSQNPV